VHDAVSFFQPQHQRLQGAGDHPLHWTRQFTPQPPTLPPPPKNTLALPEPAHSFPASTIASAHPSPGLIQVLGWSPWQACHALIVTPLPRAASHLTLHLPSSLSPSNPTETPPRRLVPPLTDWLVEKIAFWVGVCTSHHILPPPTMRQPGLPHLHPHSLLCRHLAVFVPPPLSPLNPPLWAHPPNPLPPLTPHLSPGRVHVLGWSSSTPPPPPPHPTGLSWPDPDWSAPHWTASTRTRHPFHLPSPTPTLTWSRPCAGLVCP